MPQQIDLARIELVQSRARIEMEAVEDYAREMMMGANFPAIHVVYDGEIYWCYDGCHRVLAARQARQKTILASVHEDERRDAVLRSCGVNATNGMRRTNEDKRRAVQMLLDDPEWSEWSNREIAERCKVSDQFVNNMRKELSANDWQIERKVVRGGTEYTMDTSNIGRSTSSSAEEQEPEPSPAPQQSVEPRTFQIDVVGSLAPSPKDPDPVVSDLPQEAKPSRMAVHFSSETTEYYTPQVVIDAVLVCLGEIDLDPCSNDRDHPNVPAAQHYTRDDDGLAQEWRGRIYMNPPYGREIDRWIEKLCFEHEAGHAIEAIALVPSRTDTQWWFRLRDYPVCFVAGRLNFVGSDNSAPFPSAIFYLGENIGAFYRVFNELGDCWQRMEPGISFGE